MKGKLDRRITIEARSVTEDSFGGEVEGWATAFTCYANYDPGSGGEQRVAAAQEQGQMPASFDVRHSTSTAAIRVQIHRISFDGSKWDIESISEIGRRDGLRLIARRVMP